MKYQTYIKGIIYAAAIVWTSILFFEKETLHLSLLKPLFLVVTIVLWLALAFDVWLWKLSFLHDWLVKRPVIEGTWTAIIQTNWVDPRTGNVKPPIEAFMVVRQTFSMLYMRLLTPESISSLIGTEIVCSPDGIYCVSGVYRNEPKLDFREDSPIHYGAVWLQISDDDRDKTIAGHYWTDRNTAGSLELKSRVDKKFHTFEAAQAHRNLRRQ